MVLRVDAVPVVQPARRVPLALREPLREELQRMEQGGIIAKVTEPTDWRPHTSRPARLTEPLYSNRPKTRDWRPLLRRQAPTQLARLRRRRAVVALKRRGDQRERHQHGGQQQHPGSALLSIRINGMTPLRGGARSDEWRGEPRPPKPLPGRRGGGLGAPAAGRTPRVVRWRAVAGRSSGDTHGTQQQQQQAPPPRTSGAPPGPDRRRRRWEASAPSRDASDPRRATRCGRREQALGPRRRTPCAPGFPWRPPHRRTRPPREPSWTTAGSYRGGLTRALGRPAGLSPLEPRGRYGGRRPVPRRIAL
ncbi:uncharacterized protein LOC144120167 [Amblyomma americanum]